MTARVIHSECLEWLRTQPDNSIDAIVTDPPYGLSNHTPKAIRKCLSQWLAGETYTHTGGGFMNKAWDAFVPGPEVWAECLRVLKPGGFCLCFAGTRSADLMGISLRLGGFEIRDSILAWVYGSGFPKSLSLGRAVDAAHGAEREVIGPRVYANGCKSRWPDKPTNTYGQDNWTRSKTGYKLDTAPSTDDGRRFEPYGTSLKPAHEPIIVARKPLDGTHAHNAMKWGTGGINVDGCRVTTSETPEQIYNGQTGPIGGAGAYAGTNGTVHATGHNAGRWPPNVVLSHAVGCRKVGTRTVKGVSEEQRARARAPRPGGFVDTGAASGGATSNGPQYGTERVDAYECVQGCPVGELSRQSGTSVSKAQTDLRSDPNYKNKVFGRGMGGTISSANQYDDTGTAARFFPTFDPPFQYVAKASRAEREAGCEHLDAVDRADLTGRKPDSAGLVGSDGSGNNPYCGANYKTPIRNTHPTVKPARGLMTWLVRLVTPPNPDAVILDPFCGSGSTGIACVLERVNFVGVEMDEHHVEIARARIAHAITEAGLTAQDIDDLNTTDTDVVTPRGPAQVTLF